VDVAVADRCSSGHSHENDQDHVHDHRRPLPLDVRLDHGKACLSGALRPFDLLVAALRTTTSIVTCRAMASSYETLPAKTNRVNDPATGILPQSPISKSWC